MAYDAGVPLWTPAFSFGSRAGSTDPGFETGWTARAFGESIATAYIDEIIATTYIEENTELAVPLKRLRCEDDREMPMRGDDVIGLHRIARSSYPFRSMVQQLA